MATTRDRIPELEMRANRKRHRRTILRVVAGVVDEFTNLVDALANEHFLESDQIGLEALDSLSNESGPLGPWALVVPDIQGENFQRHISNLAVEAHPDRLPRRVPRAISVRDIADVATDLAARFAML